jgi:AcrR family transcriptional regulator
MSLSVTRIMPETRAYTKVARAAAEDRTRTALLDAAEQAFFAGPWEHVSLETIAAQAGVTKQTLLRHFGSKDGLLEKTYERAFDRVRAERLSAPTHDIEGAIDNLLDHYEQHGGRAMKIGAVTGDGPMEQFGRQAREMHYAWIEHAFGAWLDRTGGRERRRLRAALIATCDVQAWWILAHDLGLPRRDVRATLILTIRRLLRDET